MLRLKSSSLILILLFIAAWPFVAKAQQAAIRSNRDIILSQDFPQKEFAPHKRPFLLLNSKSKLVKYNPVSLTFGLAMYTYQHVISPQFSAGCLYSPSCSEFSKAVIKDQGLVWGILFSADRLTRCNRMAAEDIKKSYYDPKDHKVHESVGIYHLH
jgi:putative component of membrane protein insertase Oxa1/YidC/SpoIIIJ protein YidD